MKNWIKKITTEYKKSGMNPVQFIFWTIRSNIDEIKRKRAIAR